MAKKNFIMMSMEDSKIKKISNVISNDSCRKILDYLAEREATESELAAKLMIPISTVHYNLQQLMETDLISADEFHYSKKGKEVQHYKLANKYIIIAPKNVYGIKDKLKGFLPAALITLAAAGILQFAQKYYSTPKPMQEAAPMMAKSGAADSSAGLMRSAPIQAAATETASTFWQNAAIWFLAGAVFALLVYFIWILLSKKRN